MVGLRLASGQYPGENGRVGGGGKRGEVGTREKMEEEMNPSLNDKAWQTIKFERKENPSGRHLFGHNLTWTSSNVFKHTLERIFL